MLDGNIVNVFESRQTNSGLQVDYYLKKYMKLIIIWSFPSGSVGKESACSTGYVCSIPGLGRSPGAGNGNPVQHPCLENLMDRGAWWAAAHGVAKKSGTTERLTLTLTLTPWWLSW